MVNTVKKAFDILFLLARSDSMGISEISSGLGIPKSSAHSIIMTMLENGILQRNPETRRVHLGPRLIELGNDAQTHLDLVRIANPLIRQLNEQTDETVHLTIFDRDEVLYVDCVESKKRLRTYSVIGVRAPLYCTSVGKAILAFQPIDEVERIIDTYGLPPVTTNTITDRESLLADLAKVRQRGYAIDDREHEEHLRCIGAPIRDARGTVFASISISGPEQRITHDAIPDLAEYVVTVAQTLSSRLGNRKTE